MLSRTELWKQGFWIWMKNPILGVGVGTYEIAEGMSHADVGGKWSAAHNSFIQVGTEMGFVGFGAWFALIVLSILNARATAKAAREHPELASLEWIAMALEMALYTYIVVGFALSQGYSGLLYFMCGLATALRLQVRDHLARIAAPEPAVTSLRIRP
jgi:O-antigen ligase